MRSKAGPGGLLKLCAAEQEQARESSRIPSARCPPAEHQHWQDSEDLVWRPPTPLEQRWDHGSLYNGLVACRSLNPICPAYRPQAWPQQVSSRGLGRKATRPSASSSAQEGGHPFLARWQRVLSCHSCLPGSLSIWTLCSKGQVLNGESGLPWLAVQGVGDLPF